MLETFQSDCVQVEVQGGTATLWLDVPGRTHNVFNRKILADLETAFERVAADPSSEVLLVRSRKKAGFAAGADLQEFTTITKPEEAMALSGAGQRLFDKLEALRVPTVAVIHGPCLGGGLELALACDYRVVLDQPATQLGLPEIELGLIPGWGGTQRLPRVIGLEAAVQIILQRRRLNAREALQWGLADWLAANPDDVLSLVKTVPGGARQLQKRPKKDLPRRTWRQRFLERTALGRWLFFRGAERIVRRRLPDDMPAPLEALQAMKVGLKEGLPAGLAYEREAIGRLAGSTACRNLVTLYFLMENARKLPETALSEGPDIRRVGIVGAGTMGAGIAQLAAIKGFEVVVQEVNDAALAAGMKKIAELLQKAAARRILTPDEAQRQLERMGQTTTWQGFGEVDLVIEAVIEDLDKKREVFRELDRRTRPETILATNTSSLLVKQLQQGLEYPERVAGLHFFNPVHQMPLVEVVKARDTGEAVAAGLTRWAAALGKTPLMVGDSPGFLVNRILMPYLNEAGMLAAEGLPIDRIDQVMKRFGMIMGPLEVLDQVGLDVAAHIARAVGPAFAGRLTPHPALERMCQAGWLGVKTGLGFYRHQGKKKTVHTEALAKLAAEGSVERPPRDDRTLTERLEEARERMVCLMVNEAAACLVEGVADRAEVIDLAMVLGSGWAPHRGGPLRYADDRGVADIVAALDDLARRIGPRFQPCAELRRRAGTGQRFYGDLGRPKAV